MTGASPFRPTTESFRATDRAVNPASIPNHSPESQRFFSRAGSSNESPMIHQQANSGARTVQPERTEGGFNRAGNTGMNQPQQGVGRPAWRNFGSGNAEAQGSAATQEHGMNSANRPGGANQPQPNADRPSGRGFGSRNSGAEIQAAPE